MVSGVCCAFECDIVAHKCFKVRQHIQHSGSTSAFHTAATVLIHEKVVATTSSSSSKLEVGLPEEGPKKRKYDGQ